jgi:uncharacterized membrane protein
MTQQQAFNSDSAVQALRAVLAAIIAAAFIGLVVLLAAVLTAAAFVIAGLAVLGAGAFWVYRKVRGRRQSDSSVLVARRGPHGWTVDGVSAPRG